MLGFLSKLDALDWRQDPDYVAAVAVAMAAKNEEDHAEAARVAAWREEAIQGAVNPPPDSRYWAVKAVANAAAQAYADAAAVRDRAEASAKAAVRPGVIEDYRDRAARIFAIEDQLMEELIELDALRNSAEGQGVAGLPWIAPGQMSLDHLRDNHAARRTLVEQFE